MIDTLFNLDVPTLAKILGFSVGFLWGEAFSNLDYQMKQTSWYLNQNTFWKWFWAGIMDTMHHFQYGLALIIFTLKLDVIISMSPSLAWLNILTYTTPNLILMYVGIGLVSSDIRDYEYVLKRMGLRE